MKALNRTAAARPCSLIGLAAFCAAQTLSATEPDHLICGFENVEDMVAIPGSLWIIGSGVGDRFFQKGGLHLFHTGTATGKKLLPDMPANRMAHAPYDQCPGPADPDTFSAHGLSLATNADGTHTLYVVNHGGRESIEIFEVNAAVGDEPSVHWIGCILAPEQATTNAIAARADGTLVLSASYAGDIPVPQFHELAAMNLSLKAEDIREQSKAIQYGAVFTWTRAKGWQKVRNSALPGNNGIELSRDGKWAFVNSWPSSSVTHMPLSPGTGTATEIPLPFKPDNIRWSDDGKLVATGHLASVESVALCVLGENPDCAIDYASAEIDPESFTVTPLFQGTGTKAFGGATIGLKTGHALWLGAVRSHCIAMVDLPTGTR